MKRQQGIAIVTSIIILVVIMALGTGVLFMTNTNLKTSENVRSNAIAEANAQSGIDVASLLLREAYIENDTFPQSLISSFPNTDTYAIDDYQLLSSDQAMVKIVGKSASSGEFVSEAIIKMYDGESYIPPIYEMGLASEGMVTVTSNAALYVDAAVHGNSGIDLGGTFATCTARVGTLCTAYSTLDTPPVSISSSSAVCKIKSRQYSTVCSNKASITTSAIDIDSAYHTRRDRAADLDEDGVFVEAGFSTSGDCAGAVVSNSLTSAASNNKYCINGNVNIATNPLVLSNTTIIASGNITISGAATLTNVKIISLDGAVTLGGNVTGNGVRVFSEASLNLSTKSYTWSGINTIATAGNITFNGSNNTNNTVNAVFNDDGTPAIGLALIANGNITFNGRNSATDNYYASFIAGGELTQNGRSNFYGTISAQGNLRFNGNFFIDSGLDNVNTDMMEPGDPRLGTLVRR